MTGIILKCIDDNNFNILSFYKARAIRILPALSALCMFLIIFGWFFLSPLNYKDLGKHVLGSVTFLSNIIYWQEAGYFNAASHEKWLLHTWSLSVEWQFYLIFPVVLIAIRKLFDDRYFRYTILISCVLCFLFCIYATFKWSGASYYLLPTRTWEMLLGAVAYLYPIKFSTKKKRNLEWLGLLMILISYFFISSSNPWPGYLALLPAYGAFLIIQAERNDGWIANNIAFQKIGIWSYSIYLWHWPLVVANLHFNIELGFFGYSMISLFFGVISYYFFERKNNTVLFFYFPISFLGAIFVFYTNGFQTRIDEKYTIDRSEFHSKYYGGTGYPANNVFYINGNDKYYDYIVIGDSYGLQYSKFMDDNGFRVAALFDHGCLIFPRVSRFLNHKEDTTCSNEYIKLKPILSNNEKPLIMAHSWDTYADKLIYKDEENRINMSLDEYYNLIKSELDFIVVNNGDGREYFVVGVPQRSEENLFECLAREQLPLNKLFASCNNTQKQKELPINVVLSDWAKKRGNTHFINPNDFLCKNGECKVIENYEPIHSDKHHLSIFGAEIVAEGIFKSIREIIRRN